MNEIDLAFVGKVLLGCGIIAAIAIFWGDIRPWILSRVRERRELTITEGAARTERTNERTNERSPHDNLWRAFLLDRTRTRLIAVMVDSDMTVTEIRGLLKGEATAIGQEVEAARQLLGKPPSHPYRTPIAGRPTDPTLYADDPALEYEPLDKVS